MRRGRSLLTLVMIGTLLAPSDAEPAPSRPDHFPPEEMMTIGVYYYPEAWPEDQWERDFARIRAMGLEFVHMSEFAWALMEPEEGRFDFAWLDRAVALAKKNGLRIILCTPTATPPVWLSRAHPDILAVDAAGVRLQHGSRAHACWNSPDYRAHGARIINALIERYHDDTAVVGWQIDNELSHYGKDYCYCSSCRDAFRAWLLARYTDVGSLNVAWGTTFWSQTYESFDEIEIPNPAVLPQAVNPHALLDFQRWFAESAAEYIRLQTGLLRKHGRRSWITTNFMTLHKQVSPPLSSGDLELATSTLYPVVGYGSDDAFRIGDPVGMSFMHDLLRGSFSSFGIMELQPGQVNWGPANSLPAPGAVRLWIWRAFAAGARLVSTYRLRQPLSGAELYHSGLLKTDGVTLSTGGSEFVRAMEELRALRAARVAEIAEPSSYISRRTALLVSAENRWDLDNHPQTNRWNTLGHWFAPYRALKSFGAPVDVVTEQADFSRYRFLVAPAYQLLDSDLVARWTSYVSDGGHLLLTCRSGQKDRRGHLWEDDWAAPIRSLIGARIEGYDLLPAPRAATVKTASATYAWGVWADLLEPDSGTEVLATYADQFYAGKAAVVTRRLGKGTVTYIGVESMDGALEREILAGVFARAGVATAKMPPGVLIDWRDGFWIATNFAPEPREIEIPSGARILLGGRNLPSAGVAVWTD